jgi:hypothetical protein
VSTTDADHRLSIRLNSANVFPTAYRKMLWFLFLGASAVVAILVLPIFVPYAAQKAVGQSIPIFPLVVMARTIGAFFNTLQASL